MIKLKLMQGGKEKEYIARGVTLRTSIHAYDLYRRYGRAEGDYTEDLLDECAEFICTIFGHAFNADDLLNGYQGSAFRLYPAMMNAIIGYTNDEIVNFPDPAPEATKAKTKANS